MLQRLVLAKEAADLCGSQLTMLDHRALLRRGPVAHEPRSGSSTIYREPSRRDAGRARPNASPPTRAWTTPAGGFYVWVTLPEYFDTPALLAAAVERKVAYVPGTAFYPDGRGRRQMRLSFCYPPEDRIDEGVRRLGELLSDEEELYRSLSR